MFIISIMPPSRPSQARLTSRADDPKPMGSGRLGQRTDDIDSIRELLQLATTPDRPCNEADRIAEAHLQAVEDKIAKLASLRAELRRMLKECGKEQIAECRVIESLGDHKLCKARRHEVGCHLVVL
jgi:hypothetical protein